MGGREVVISVLEYVWLLGVVGSAAMLTYGGWRVLHFELSASKGNKRVVARLALHDSNLQRESLAEVKAVALADRKSKVIAERQMRKAA